MANGLYILLFALLVFDVWWVMILPTKWILIWVGEHCQHYTAGEILDREKRYTFWARLWPISLPVAILYIVRCFAGGDIR